MAHRTATEKKVGEMGLLSPVQTTSQASRFPRFNHQASLALDYFCCQWWWFCDANNKHHRKTR
jgi:hypothetical protein